jgi:UPF0755 protein
VAKKNRKKPSFINRIFIIVIIGIIIIIGIKGYQFYKGVEEPNVNLNGKEVEYIYIPSGSDFNDVLHLLTVNKLIIHTKTFEWVAEKKGYIDNVKPGKYKIRADMSNNALVNLLRSGKQEPVRLVFNKVRTKERFAGIIAEQIEADSIDLLTKLNDRTYLETYNKNLETALTLFIPNTYELYWNTTAEGFVDRMYKEYTRFWNNSRLQKAKNLNMSPEEIFTLASIVEEETNKNDEKQKVAGVYLNRLRKGMRLQADPTIKYALGNFEIKRILTKHLEFDSPYNTYKNGGLPPGPICIPTISSIDAVLNYEKHSYLYFCANADFSGYHAFAKTLIEHNQNAAKYRSALDRNRIYK